MRKVVYQLEPAPGFKPVCRNCGAEMRPLVLDNRDGYYDDMPNTLSTYDTRTMMVISRARYAELRRIEENARRHRRAG